MRVLLHHHIISPCWKTTFTLSSISGFYIAPVAMCKSSLHNFLVAAPKVENHVHVEGTMEPEMLFTFAARNRIDLPRRPEWESPESLQRRYGHFSCLDEFLDCLYTGASVLITAIDFEELAWAYFLKAVTMRIRHIEVSFDPQMHTVRGISYDVVVEGLVAAKKRAVEELGLTVEYIVCFHRHLPLADSMTLANIIMKRGHLSDGTICGVGLVSNEKPFPAGMFASLFEYLAPTGAMLTAHVGEEVGPEAIREALRHLGVSRIDHGLTSAQDPSLMEDLARDQTLLTLCPWSNVAIGILPDLSHAPVRQFLDAGICFSINNDDPAYDGCFLQDVYCRVQETFNLTLEEWNWINRSAIRGSFLAESRMEELLREYDAVSEQYAGII